jgi:hypothetical protein
VRRVANEKRQAARNENPRIVRHTSDTDARLPQRKTARAVAIESRFGTATKSARADGENAEAGMSGTAGIRPGFNAPRRQRVLKGTKPHERRPATPVARCVKKHASRGEL